MRLAVFADGVWEWVIQFFCPFLTCCWPRPMNRVCFLFPWLLERLPVSRNRVSRIPPVKTHIRLAHISRRFPLSGRHFYFFPLWCIRQDVWYSLQRSWRWPFQALCPFRFSVSKISCRSLSFRLGPSFQTSMLLLEVSKPVIWNINERKKFKIYNIPNVRYTLLSQSFCRFGKLKRGGVCTLLGSLKAPFLFFSHPVALSSSVEVAKGIVTVRWLPVLWGFHSKSFLILKKNIF